jgi:hypothetical protein
MPPPTSTSQYYNNHINTDPAPSNPGLSDSDDSSRQRPKDTAQEPFYQHPIVHLPTNALDIDKRK